MSRRGVANWPPAWLWRHGRENTHPKGEVGILTSVMLSQVRPMDRFFLFIEHEGSHYIGCLLFDDPDFCRQVAEVLKFCCNRPMAEIGSLDLYDEMHNVKSQDIRTEWSNGDNLVVAKLQPFPTSAALAQEAVGGEAIIMSFWLGNGLPVSLAVPSLEAEKLRKQLGQAVRKARWEFSQSRH